MVELTFNLLGYIYESGTKVLQQSYSAARDALETAVENAASDELGYRQAQEQGAEFIGERDEDGQIIWSQDEILEYQHHQAVDALRSFRRAFAIAIYHHWERGARSWTLASKGANHGKLVREVEKLGMSVHPRLEALRCVANLLKHDNDTWGHRVLNVAPEFIDQIQVTPGLPTEWYEAVVLSDAHLEEFFRVVAMSGPTHLTTVALGAAKKATTNTI